MGKELGRYGIQRDQRSWCCIHLLLERTQSEESREAVAGFAIKTELAGKLSGLPKSISDCA